MCCFSLLILNNVSIVLIAMDILIGTSISIKLNRNLIIMVLTGSNALDCGIEDNSNELTLAVMFKNDPTASNAIYKFTLLTFIYIASTFCTLTFCVIFGNYSILWMSVDTIIGTIATALMFSVHSGIYNQLCLKLQKVCVSVACIELYSCHYCCPVTNPFISQSLKVSDSSPLPDCDRDSKSISVQTLEIVNNPKINIRREASNLNERREVPKLHNFSSRSLMLKDTCSELFASEKEVEAAMNDVLYEEKEVEPDKKIKTVGTVKERQHDKQKSTALNIDIILEGIESPTTHTVA